MHLDETDSTNHWLREHGEGDMVVVADYQTAGRGCGTNRWESERGRNLLFSMLFHPTQLSAASQFFISQAVSVALCETLEQYIDRRVEIKWPNDIYVDDRKICGILIENRLQGSVIRDSIIGIGLNVNQRVFVSDAPNPVSLYQLTGQETDSLQLLDRFLLAFDSAFNSKTTCFTYKSMLFRKGKYAIYEDKTSCFTATLTDVLPDGRLLLVDKDGQERLYAFKEVSFII